KSAAGTLTIKVTPDNIAPALTISNPPQDMLTSLSSFAITGTVSDQQSAVALTMTINGIQYYPTVSNGSFSQLLNLTAGQSYAINAIATDQYGNTSTVHRNLISYDPQAAHPSLLTSSASVPKGSSTVITLTLENAAGVGVSSLSTDIAYDAALLDVSSVTAGEAATAAGKDVSFSTPSAGVLRIGILSFGNSNLIGNGVVARINLGVRLTAPDGNVLLTASPVMSDASGNLVFASSTGGVIQVFTKPGDCDGNGSVNIAEVQSAISMFLGLKPSERCVDIDRNGLVSIAEVQKAINSFLGP
ncbi:MAG: hypothetical protein HY888_02600, partial [Deltaproteobacteria bacterium]|nr:hypothetical protein [Deltaproteobacteria bacterium]